MPVSLYFPVRVSEIPLLGVTFLAALVAALVLTHRARSWGHRVRVLDRPDGLRRRHSHAVPRAGGVGILLACTLGLLVWAAFGGPDAALFQAGAGAALTIAGGAGLVFLLGMRDDVRHIRARIKLLVQVLIAGAVCLAGFVIPPQALGLTGAGPLDAALIICLTLLWIVGVTNSVNLLDGSDGVAGGAAAIGAIALMAAAVLLGVPLLAACMAVLAGACIGFLRFNFPPASIFLGDGGSLFLGFSLAIGTLALVRAAPTPAILAAAAMAVAVPVADTLLVMYRRIAAGRPIFAPDRAHIHHLLLERGHRPAVVALFIYTVAALAGGTTIGLVFARPPFAFLWFAAVALIGVACQRYLRVPEVRSIPTDAAGD